MFPQHLTNMANVLRNCADKEQSLERSKRMTNTEQQTKTHFISVWYECVTMSGWDQTAAYIHECMSFTSLQAQHRVLGRLCHHNFTGAMLLIYIL